MSIDKRQLSAGIKDAIVAVVAERKAELMRALGQVLESRGRVIRPELLEKYVELSWELNDGSICLSAATTFIVDATQGVPVGFKNHQEVIELLDGLLDPEDGDPRLLIPDVPFLLSIHKIGDKSHLVEEAADWLAAEVKKMHEAGHKDEMDRAIARAVLS